MEILITNNFLKDFESIIKIKNGLDIFLKNLKKLHVFRLNDNLYKFKFYITNISIRGIVFTNINKLHIPILIIKKSNKQYGNNLVLNKEIDKILKIKILNMNSDLEKGTFNKFEI